MYIYYITLNNEKLTARCTYPNGFTLVVVCLFILLRAYICAITKRDRAVYMSNAVQELIREYFLKASLSDSWSVDDIVKNLQCSSEVVNWQDKCWTTS